MALTVLRVIKATLGLRVIKVIRVILVLRVTLVLKVTRVILVMQVWTSPILCLLLNS